jgi:uncharacterized protein YjaG (DUF416 family)
VLPVLAKGTFLKAATSTMLSNLFGVVPSEEAAAALDAVVTALVEEELTQVAVPPSNRDVKLLAQLRHWTAAWRFKPSC